MAGLCHALDPDHETKEGTKLELSKLHVPLPEGIGWLPIVSPDNRQTQWLSLTLLRLEAGGSYEGKTDGEAVAVVLFGTVDAEADGQRWNNVGQRRDVFGGKAFALYLPSGTQFRIRAQTASELAIATAPYQPGGTPQLITPEQVKRRSVGQLNWRRDIDDIVDASFPAKRLLVGETRNPSGNWSSYPPHKHEFEDPPFEACLEEVYHFRVYPPNGFAVQLLYSEDGELNHAFIVRDGDTIVIPPKSYHPVIAPPGYQVCYLWVLAGEGRRLFFHYDPKHEWVMGAESILKDLQNL